MTMLASSNDSSQDLVKAGPRGLGQLLRVRQRLHSHALESPGQSLLQTLEALRLPSLEGRRILVAVPSRGIDRMDQVLAALADWLRGRGAQPSLIPAMGSHGGGTPAGQIDQLRRLGLDESSTRTPLQKISGYREMSDGFWLPKEVLSADGLILVNRIKLHTIFDGPVQSGLCKILAFGLGGPLGAEAGHRKADELGLLTTVRQALDSLTVPSRLLFAVGLVEDSTHRLARIEAVLPPEILEADQRLLRLAADWHPRLPLPQGDLLVVERMGKDISGSGLDPHVIGRPPGSPQNPCFRQIFVRSLTSATHGNALGIGYADHTLASLVASMDHEATLLNARTSGSLHKARIPQVHSTDRQAIEAALPPVGTFLQISDTLQVTEALVAGYTLQELDGLEVLQSLGPLAFRPDGRLLHLLTEETPG